MDRVIAYLLRFAIIIGGYAIASLAASAFLNIVILGWAGFTAEEMPMVAANLFRFSIPLTSLFVAFFALIPSVFAILAGEFLGKRDWLFYAVAGGVIGAIVGAFGSRSTDPHIAVSFDPALVVVMIGSGMCGGIGYWLVAGRTAGKWRERLDITSPAP